MRRLPKIHKAAEVGDVAGIDARLAAGDHVDKLWMHDYTPLHLASFEGHVECVRCLLRHGANPNWADSDLGMTALHNAAINGHVECVVELLDANAAMEATSFDGSTPLIDAAGCVSNALPTLKELLGRGANVLATAQSGTTALHEAARRGDVESCELLLSYGADPSVRDKDGLSADDIALFAGCIDLCKALRSLYWFKESQDAIT